MTDKEGTMAEKTEAERIVDTPLAAAQAAWRAAKAEQGSGEAESLSPLEAAVQAALTKDRAQAGLSRRFNVQTQNKLGEWVPAIPMPLLGTRKKCLDCGAKFWTLDAYRGHYALKHVLDPEVPDAA